MRQSKEACCNFNQGRRLDYLLHEATFDDNDKEKAAAKKHTCFSQALQVGDDLQVRKLILSHFSQRYTTYPPMIVPSELRIARKGTLAFAMDGILIPLS